MIIAYASDIHLEFGQRDFDLPDADILLLAGDICVIDHLRPFVFTKFGSGTRQFFIDVAAKYKTVIYIPGNHEFYDGCIEADISIVNDFLKDEGIENIIYSHCNNVLIDDVKFVFATLWTDFNKGNPLVTNSVQHNMNDYQKIMIGDFGLDSGVRYITSADIEEIHNQHRNHIRHNIECEKVVVMTHHAPNMLSRGRSGLSTMDYAYCCTDMDDVILDNEQIKYWVCGHTHTRNSYMIGNTNVLSNCRGYSGHEDTKSFEIKTFSI